MEIAYLQTASDTTDASTYTFSAQNIGTAASDRYIIVTIGTRAAGTTAFSISSVTVGGISVPSIIEEYHNAAVASTLTGIVMANVPTGTTGDIVVTLNRTAVRCTISAYRATGIKSTAFDHGESGVAAPTYAIDVPLGGFAIGVVAAQANPASVAWTNLTENYDAVIETAMIYSTASASFLTVQTDLSLTATITGTATENSAVFASFEPVQTSGYFHMSI